MTQSTQQQAEPTVRPTVYRYFVSYVCQRYGGMGHGWCEVNLAYPIRTGEDIKTVTKRLEQQDGVGQVTVLNFQRFDG